jgi:hypothetical protein
MSDRLHVPREQLRRSPADGDYFEQLAQRLVEQCGLPFALAQRRVMALAISAQPPPKTDGVSSRGA